MARSIDSFNKRRLITSYFSVIVSITLVLFLLGFFGFLVFSTKKLANHFKEQVTVTILIKDEAKSADIVMYGTIGSDEFWDDTLSSFICKIIAIYLQR